MRKLLMLTFILLACNTCFSQSERPDIKFGEISAKDFEPVVYSIDSSAHAVILFDVMKAEYEGDNTGGFNIVYKFHKRVRLLSKNAFDEATVEIPMLTSNTFEDELKKIEAYTYNIEGGEVQKVKVDKSSIFKDKVTKGFYVKKFTFPALKEGSIIEYQYTIVSPFERNLVSWIFQDTKYPTLWSEYDVTVPELYNFLPVPRVFYPYAIEKQSTSNATYSLINRYASNNNSGMFVYNAVNTRRVWAMANIPALKEESFTTTLDNYLSQINFYLLSINYPNQAPIPIIKDWYQTAAALLKNENFAAPISEANNWMKDDLEQLIKDAPSEVDKIKNIFYYVRNNFECTGQQLMLTQTLKKTFQEKKGGIGDLNLLLAAMYYKLGYVTDPVLLSTRNHGKPYETYPVLNQFNYVVVRLVHNGQVYLLDASDKKNAFDKLPAKCYNGSGRIIAQTPSLIDIVADSIMDAKITTVFIINENKKLAGSYSSTLGYFTSNDLREKLAKESQEDYFKSLKKKYPFDIDIQNTTLDSLKNYDHPVSIKYDFTFETDEDLLYINPLFADAQKENPFKAESRLYPIEMPYKLNETYILNMDIPEGYTVDDLPKSVRLKLNEDEGMFEYIISNNGSKIQLRSKLVLNKATFLPDDYATLRDFFAFIVKKHQEQIVFKKK